MFDGKAAEVDVDVVVGYYPHTEKVGVWSERGILFGVGCDLMYYLQMCCSMENCCGWKH